MLRWCASLDLLQQALRVGVEVVPLGAERGGSARLGHQLQLPACKESSGGTKRADRTSCRQGAPHSIAVFFSTRTLAFAYAGNLVENERKHNNMGRPAKGLPAR